MEVDIGITFGNPVSNLPPQRKLMGVGIDHVIELTKIPMDVVKSRFKMCQKGQDGSWLSKDPRLLQYWVESLWESLFDPIIVVKDGKEFRVKHGKHRMYTLLALEASHVWAYVAPSGVSTTRNFHPFRSENIRIPRRGAMVAFCRGCGAKCFVRPSKRKEGETGLRREYKCRECGEFEVYNPYPKDMSEVV